MSNRFAEFIGLGNSNCDGRWIQFCNSELSFLFGLASVSRPHELRILKFLLDSNGPPLTCSGTLLGENSYKNERLMKTCSLIIIGAVFMVLTHLAGANQADDTTITITGHTAGATPFISNLTLEVSNTTVLKSIQFAIDPKPGSVTRPLSGTYANDYLVSRGFEQPPPADYFASLRTLRWIYEYRKADLSLSGRFFKASCHLDHDRHF